MSDIKNILEKFRNGEIDIDAAVRAISSVPIINLGHTKIDADRLRRTGMGEVIYGAGKTDSQITEIASALIEAGQRVLATRLSDSAMCALSEKFGNVKICKIARAAWIGEISFTSRGRIALVSAGTSDMPVAEEARVCAEFFGSKVDTYYDCGVAGLSRLLSVIDRIREARVVIVVAGMEGALASVAAGLLRVPVIAVPTSVGYGANFGGLSALLSMINSCANGVSIVNIDNGFGAAYNAHLINNS